MLNPRITKSPIPLIGGTRFNLPSTPASPCSGVPFSVALLNVFVLSPCLLSLFMTIMGTSLVTNCFALL